MRESKALSSERLAEIRRWLDAGGHDQPEITAAIAHELLRSGDLEMPSGGRPAPPTG